MARETKTASKKPIAAQRSSKRGRGSGAVAVYDEVRRDILGLVMKPGTLLDETELAERFKLSRSPVREALIRLSAEGLVQTLRNRSSIVAPFDIVAVPCYLDAVELLYRLTTRLAAINRKPAQLKDIQAVHREHLAAVKRRDLASMISLNRDFHLAIAEASGNSYYIGWTRQVLDQGQRILGLYLHDAGQFEDSLNTHWGNRHLAIVKAIEAQDADAAEEAARRDAEVIASQMRDRFGARPSGQLSLSARAK
jgi:DNA-binding GntR family transcriptional regulator